MRPWAWLLGIDLIAGPRGLPRLRNRPGLGQKGEGLMSLTFGLGPTKSLKIKIITIYR